MESLSLVVKILESVKDGNEVKQLAEVTELAKAAMAAELESLKLAKTEELELLSRKIDQVRKHLKLV